MTRKHRILLFALSLLAILVTGGWLTPRLAGLIYGSQAGRLLSRALEGEIFPATGSLAAQQPVNRASFDPIPCSIPPLSSTSDLNLVQQAVLDLQRAVKLSPSASHSYLLLGRAYCLEGEPEKAIKNLQIYTRLRTKNPLGHIELGFAYEASCLKRAGGVAAGYPQAVCNETKALASMRQAWQKGGVDTGSFLSQARLAFSAKKWDGVEYNYRFGYRSGAFSEQDLDHGDLARWAIAAALSGQPVPEVVMSGAPVIRLAKKARLEVEDLVWLMEYPQGGLLFGEKIGKVGKQAADASGGRLGVLSASGYSGGWVDVTQGGRYRITVRGKNTPPAPVIVRLEVNYKLIGELTMTLEDGSYQDFTFEAELARGIHLITVQFINNAIVGGLDRNAELDIIQIEKIDS